jgi:hypothetical protein
MRQTYPTFNGHIVIEKFPADRLLMTSGGAMVCISLDHNKSYNGRSEVYVHSKCCRPVGREKGIPCYDIWLLDDQYNMYCNKSVSTKVNTKITAEELWGMAEKTKKSEYKKKERSISTFVVDVDYCNKEKFPYDVQKTI